MIKKMMGLENKILSMNLYYMIEYLIYMASFDFKYPSKAHVGNKVSHAKNRSSRFFKRNLHTVTVVVDGQKKRMRVPTKVLRMMKKSGVTTHWKKPVENK